MTFFFFFFDNDIEFFTTTSIQKQTGQTQVKSSSFIRALNDYKKEESEKKFSRCFWDSSDLEMKC